MKLSLLDRAIAAFSPQAGLQRALARQAIDAVAGVSRGYEGAKTGRRTDGWIAGGTSANAEIGPAMDRLRASARDLVRNNTWGERSAQIWRAYLVGAGIISRPTVPGADGTADKAATAKLRGEFDRWAEQCDADGVTDWYGIQSQIAESVAVDGEVLLRRRWRWKADGMRVPFQLQLLEADFLDGGKSEALNDGGWILQGKQYDARGRLTGFWLFPSHPGDLLPGVQKGYTSRFVPAGDVLHVFEPRRPGQVRGASWYAPIVMKLRDIDDYDDFEIVRKKVEASMAAFVTRQANATNPLTTTTTDAAGKRIETIRPGTIHYLPSGDEVKFSEPTGAGGYGEYMRVGAQRIAAGIGMPYELLTGDLGNVNYSSMRGGMLPFKRIIQRRQWQVLIPQLCRPVVRWWNEAAALGDVAVPENAVWRHTPPRFEYVNPLDDVQADKLAIRAGLEPFDEIVASNGWDAEEVVENMARWNEIFDRHGLTLDIDPRRISNAGVVQSSDKAAATKPKE
ncbi:MAG: phage portal protein [Reyranellaceae bacterium]